MVLLFAGRFKDAIWFADSYKPNLDLQDKKGWTVMHHAAVKKHQGLLLCLMRLNPNPDILNSYYGTYQSIFALGQKRNPDGQTIPFKERGEITKKKASDLMPTLRASTYAEEYFLSEENLFRLWLEALE